MIFDILISGLLILGGSFALIGSIGLVKLPDAFMRLHGPTKATTLGVGGVLLGSVAYFSAQSGTVALHELLILVFLFLTAPVSAHMMAKAALHRRLKSEAKVPDRSWKRAPSSQPSPSRESEST